MEVADARQYYMQDTFPRKCFSVCGCHIFWGAIQSARGTGLSMAFVILSINK